MKRGQAAMEFLMTYGWAILVVIAAIAALAYFGVLDPARLLPERCQSSAGMDCIDKAAISETGVQIALRNNIGFPITITNIDGTECTGATIDAAIDAEVCTPAAVALSQTVANNAVVRLCITCDTALVSGDKYDDTLVVTYTNDETGLAHTVPVDVRGLVP
jgi:hypothetical protein